MSKPKDEKEVGCDAVCGSFVTAKLQGENDCRQGWVVNVDPLMIRGESGKVYCCENVPTLVEPQPPSPWWNDLYTFGLEGHRVSIFKGRRKNPVMAIRNPTNGATVKCYL